MISGIPHLSWGYMSEGFTNPGRCLDSREPSYWRLRVVDTALRRDSAAQRHLVWLLALGSTLLWPLFSALLPAWRVLPHWAGRTATTRIESRD